MKKILLSMAVLLAVGSSVPTYAQRHRHTPRTEATAKQNDTEKEPSATSTDEAAAGSEGIEAYSDTSSVADNTSSYAANDDASVSDSNRYDPSRFDDPFSWFAFLCSTGFIGVIVTILIIVLFLLFLFMPLIIVLLLIRYFVKRHNDRVRLAEKAMEEGRPLTDEQMPLSRRSPESMWRRGVKNVSIGIGLMVLFWCLGANSIVGIGGLLACMGGGQMFMARYNHDSKFGRKKNDSGNFNGFDGDFTDLKFGDDKDKQSSNDKDNM